MEKGSTLRISLRAGQRDNRFDKLDCGPNTIPYIEFENMDIDSADK
jgi:hypothetical protein